MMSVTFLISGVNDFPRIHRDRYCFGYIILASVFSYKMEGLDWIGSSIIFICNLIAQILRKPKKDYFHFAKRTFNLIIRYH